MDILCLFVITNHFLFQDLPLCEHPLADISIAGKAVAPLPEMFHTLLQTISDVMMYLPASTALQVQIIESSLHLLFCF